MSYTAEISRGNPSCFLFLIDQSGSMEDPVPTATGQTLVYGAPASPGKSKAQGVADAINRLLQNLVIKCAKSEGVRDYYHVGVIGYGADGVGPAFAGDLKGKIMAPISEIADHPARIEERTRKMDDGAGGLVDQAIRFPTWFDPTARGGTPMCQALRLAQSTLADWLNAHKECFPPVVIHITDGESTDGDPASDMHKLRELHSSDGSVLLFNLHLSGNSSATPITFPDSADPLPDKFARMLFESASELTPFMREVAQQEHGMSLSDGARGFVLNADLTLIIQALDIGTRPSNLR